MPKRSTTFFLFFSLLLGAGLLFVLSQLPNYPITQLQISSAQAGGLDLGINAVNQTIGLASADPRVLIARIISIALTLLGIVAVSFVLYGGFLWMSAGGEEEKIIDAKRFLVNAGIGLVIVLSAWSITTFVLNRLIEATTGGGQVIIRDNPEFDPESGGSGGFRVLDIRPRDPTPRPDSFAGYCKNAVIRINMSEAVDAGTVPTAAQIQPVGEDTAISLEAPVVEGSLISLRPATPCAETGFTDQRCFDPGRTYRVRVGSGLRGSAPPFRSCNPPLGQTDCGMADITIRDCLDIEPPEVVITNPTQNQSIEPDWLTLRARATDDQAISAVTFILRGPYPVVSAALEPEGALTPVDAEAPWDAARLSPQMCAGWAALAFDADDHRAPSEIVETVIRAGHCFDNVQNGGETGLDCGGDPTSGDYCGKCAGEACSGADFSPPDSCALACRSGACVGGVCRDIPRIDDFNPKETGPGSYIIIEGEFFGSAPGSVIFLGGAGSGDDVVATLAACTDPWRPDRIIVQAPAGVTRGPLQVTNAAGESDRTDDSRGGVASFIPSEISLPGICAASPDRGKANDPVRIDGNGLGETPGKVRFTSQVDRSVGGAFLTVWTATAINLTVPQLPPGPADVEVDIGGMLVPAGPFEVLSPELGASPLITAVTPSSGPPGTYVTISGANFGDRVGLVKFETGGKTAYGATDFPEACAANFWRTDSIVVKAPRDYTIPTEPIDLERHSITVVRADSAESGSSIFDITSGAPPPGLCRLDPVSGPADTRVNFFGEAFGNAANTAARFFENLRAAPVMDTTVTSNQFTAALPSGAETGNALAEVGAQISNPLLFKVQDCREANITCEIGTECCANGACSAACVGSQGRGGYAWRFSTGPIPQTPRLIYECAVGTVPSPSPFGDRTGGANVCVNANITGRLSTSMDPATMVMANFELRPCTVAEGGLITCSGDLTPVSFSLFNWSTGTAPNVQQRTNAGFTLNPTANLAVDTWYEVKITDALRGDPATTGGGFVEENETGCGNGYSYCWRFKTRNSDANCSVGSIELSPAEWTATEQNEVVSYTTACRAEGDSCVTIDCGDYDFSWTALDPDPNPLDDTPPPNSSRASVVEQTSDSNADARALAETVPNPPVKIISSISSENKSDIAFLTIDFTDPYVVEKQPDCNAACVNALISARFNTRMDTDSFGGGAVALWKCLNESCTVPSEIIGVAPTLESDDRVLRITPMRDRAVRLLDPNSFYRVILSGEATSNSGVRLTKLNYNNNQDYSWIFRTKPDSTPCGIHRVEILPAEARVNLVGTRVPFDARPFGRPDECSVTGQELMAGDYNWTWSIDETSAAANVASFLDNAAIDTAPPATGCTAQCLFAGALGRSDRDALCGNGALEASLGEECDDGNNLLGDGCSRNCLREGRAAGTTCGNGGACTLGARVCSITRATICTIDDDCPASEQCQDICAGRGACLNGQCVERLGTGGGEDCDDGNQVNGDGCSTQCLNEGSVAGVSACGNGSIGVGEDCDDSTPGCRACLRIGSHPSSSSEPFSICGNGGALEAGEACDDGNLTNGDGCSDKCLPEGSSTPCTAAGQDNCCGNGDSSEAGEECDDAFPPENGDGCSARCLFEGSSAFYDNPSFCGDGLPLDTGEACEVTAGGGNGRVDPAQVVQALPGQGEVDETKTPPSQITKITATVDQPAPLTSVTGESGFIIECGFRADAECGDRTLVGVGANTCCYERPIVATTTPYDDQGENAVSATDPGVCRNALIRVNFDQVMNLSSFQGNILIGGAAAADCEAGQTELVIGHPERSEGSLADASWHAPEILLSASWWNRLRSWLDEHLPAVRAAHAPPGSAGSWCAGGEVATGKVRGVHNGSSATTSTLIFELDKPLESLKWYKVRVGGDDVATPEVEGVRSINGVGMNGKREFSFHTGNDICDVDLVKVEDQAGDPSVFTLPNDVHAFEATAYTDQGGILSPITPTTVYNWTWQTWQTDALVPADLLALRTTRTAADGTVETLPLNQVDVAVGTKNGTARVTAKLRITADEIPPSELNQEKSGTIETTVFICETPWPGDVGDPTPFADVPDATPGFITFGLPAPFGNFATRYCRDGNSPDLPNLVVQEIPSPAAGVFKEFVLQYPDSSVNDVIGFRVLTNSLHLSAARWYALQGFRGAPQAMQVDGFDAVRDGRTIYVHAPNIDYLADGVYSNIYVIGYNEGASAETVNIFEQLISNLRFNINIPTAENRGLCSAGSVLVCNLTRSDLDCDTGATCSAAKDKLRRDTLRLEDLRDIEQVMDRYHARVGSFPALSGGTFVVGKTTSAWPSWVETLGQTVGASLPTDPLNRFEDCAGDRATCFEATTGQFTCPRGSRIYGYNSEGSDQYRLETDLEYNTIPWNPSVFVPFVPFKCSGSGRTCDLGLPCPTGEGLCEAAPAQLFAERFPLNFSCNNEVFGNSSVCGDGILGPNEVCERDQIRYQACAISTFVGQRLFRCNATCTSFEVAPGQCVNAQGGNVLNAAGASIFCVDNTPCPTGSTCSSQCNAAFCGNGVREGTCTSGSAVGTYCRSNSDCPAVSGGGALGICTLTEICDDGAQNGRYGFCNSTCTALAAYCGDGTLAGTEQCDCGQPGLSGALPSAGGWEGGTCVVRNGLYPTTAPLNDNGTCASDCRAPGPYCGDGITQSNEECDGAVRVGNGLCTGGTQALVCDTDADCPNSTCVTGVCPPGYRWSLTNISDSNCDAQSEVGSRNSTKGTCTQYEQIRTQACDMTGADACTGFNTLSACAPRGSCGNGILDPGSGEECDDGPDTPNDECANDCKFNICGDGIPWSEVEACDLGAPNPPRSPITGGSKNGDPCAASYGGTCNFCTTSCTWGTEQGPFCGDGEQTVGPERCDYSAAPIIRAGASLPEGFGALSRCSVSCDRVCPPDFDQTSVRFQNTIGTSHDFVATSILVSPNGSVQAEIDPVEIAVPACRLGGALVADVFLGENILTFPSPISVLLVIDVSGSMNTGGINCEGTPDNRLLCAKRGLIDPNADGNTDDGFIARLFNSRPDEDVKLGIIEFSGHEARYRTGNGGTNYTTAACTTIPCYTSTEYQFGPDSAGYTEPVPAFNASGLLTSNDQNKLENIIQNLTAANGTPTFVAIKAARTILAADDAVTKIMIVISDGEAVDCCSFALPSNRTDSYDNFAEWCRADVNTSPMPPSRRDHCEVIGETIPTHCYEDGVIEVGISDCDNPGTDAYENEEKCIEAGCTWVPGASTEICAQEAGTPYLCDDTEREAANINQPNDGIHVFTIAFPTHVQTMTNIADAPNGVINYSYAGSQMGNLLNLILNSLGVSIKIANNNDFISDYDTTVDTTIVQDSTYSTVLNTENLIEGPGVGEGVCPNIGWHNIWMTADFGVLDPGNLEDSFVTITNLRWQYCSFVDF